MDDTVDNQDSMDSSSPMKLCVVCASDKTRVCSGCNSVWYCSEAHQKLNWKVHKFNCTVQKSKISANARASSQVVNKTNDSHTPSSLIKHHNNMALKTKDSDTIREPDCSDKMDLDFNSLLNDVNLTEGRFNTRLAILRDLDSDNQAGVSSNGNMNVLHSTSHEPGSASNSEAAVTMSYQPVTYLRSIITKDIVSEIKTLPFISENVSQIDDSSSTDPESEQFFGQISDYILKCLFKYSVCVIDNFMGDEIAYALHKETENLFTTQMFSDGHIVGRSSESDDGLEEHETRGDKVMWLDDIDNDLPALTVFVARLDALMNLCSGKCGHIINSRSKIMLTCYPSNGTKYKKHVDNAAQDGRCVTCLYYQNKNWDCSVQGGMLKIYPKDEKYIANIEPLFDRLVLFWSNERCPHKVLPVYADRYAVTMWYYDHNEREQHLQRLASQHWSVMEHALKHIDM